MKSASMRVFSRILPESRETRRQNSGLRVRRLAVGGVEAGEDFGTGAELGLAEAVERGLNGVEELVHVAGIGLTNQQSGADLARRVALLQIGQRRDPVIGIVIKSELPQPQCRAVVLDDGLDRARRVIGGDLVAADYDIEPVDRLVVSAH